MSAVPGLTGLLSPIPKAEATTATFREMRFTRPDKWQAVLHSSDPVLLAAVVSTEVNLMRQRYMTISSR